MKGDSERQAALRALPKIDAVLARPDVDALSGPRWAVVEAVRQEVEARRQAILARPGEQPAAPPDRPPDRPTDRPTDNREADPAGNPATSAAANTTDITAAAIAARVARLLSPSLRRVINATGVVLHTNLGRAPLAGAAMARIRDLALGYSNLEYDLGRGERGSRHGHVTGLLARLTGAEDALVVNNNAGAVLLALAALASGREVVVSRGQLVEIGGSFRVPEILERAGATLVEVGTTNKTRVDDYRAVISERTGLLLEVHPSNFAIIGFTEAVPSAALAALGKQHGVPTMMDLGSGALLSSHALAALGLHAEPSVAEILAAGIDLVTFSGDKLLGGPQAGIVCGRRDLVAVLARHALLRALRPDKLTLAALEATLELYRDGQAAQGVPAVALLARPASEIRARARAVLAKVNERAAPGTIDLELVACESRVGGGAMPLAALPSAGIAVRLAASTTLHDIERALRCDSDPPVIGRIADDRLILDLRTVLDHDIDALADALVALAAPAR